PGVVFTEMWGPEQVADYARKRNMAPEDVKEYLTSKIPMKRAATVEDVAAVAAFLASDDAAYLTGQSYNVTGGTIMH
nr:SDR family oxidoreductase [Candidatus Latescibacterota bacterium]